MTSFFSKRFREGPSPECSKEKPPAPGDEPPLKKPDRTHHQSGFDPQWAKDFPWLRSTYSGGMDQYPCQEGDGVSGMLCHLCRKHSKRPPKSAFGKPTWVDFPCVTLDREGVLRHSRSQSHQDAVTAETNLGIGFMESAYKEAISEHDWQIQMTLPALLGRSGLYIEV